MRYDVADWDAAVRALKEADEVALACHINPDGDALGSLLGASLALQQLGKKTYPAWGQDPARVPPSYAFLPGADAILPPDAIPPAETFLSLDCGGPDRLGTLEQQALESRCLVNVDHHKGNPNFGTLNVVVTYASSTAEIVARLIEDLGAHIDTDIATCLYTGIVTDTGRFQFANSTADTLRLAADLVEKGVRVPEIAHEVFESSPFDYLKLVGRVLDRATLDETAGFVHSWVTLRDLDETGVAPDETDNLIDLIRSTRAADVAALFKEQDDGKWRVSLRSRGPSVGAIARGLGGGGHDLAAGFTADDRDSAVAVVRDALAR